MKTLNSFLLINLFTLSSCVRQWDCTIKTLDSFSEDTSTSHITITSDKEDYELKGTFSNSYFTGTEEDVYVEQTTTYAKG